MSKTRLGVFPAFHRISGRPVVIVGNGAEAAAKLRLVLETEAVPRLIAKAPAIELAALIVGFDVEHHARGFRDADLDGAVLVFAASGDRPTDESVVAAARARGVPANAVDSPDLCDFFTPALINRAPVAVAIGSSGAGPVLTQKLRARIEALLPPRLGQLAALAATFRPAAEKTVPAGAMRRRFWSRFFEGRVADQVYAGRADLARREASRLLGDTHGAADGRADGFVSLVGAGPGAEDLLTLRAQRALLAADVIVHDRLVPAGIIALGRRDAARIDVGKTKGCHSKSQDEINAILVREARAGRRVVRLKAGDPLVFGRAGEEMAALRQAGIAFEIVPGVTSALAAAAEAEIPLTLRGVASDLVFATGHDQAGATLPNWAGLALSGASIAVYMARSVAGKVAGRLLEAGLAAATPVAVIENATRNERRLFAGTLAELPGFANHCDVTGPALILIGQAVARGALADAEPLARLDSLAA
jgi:uroporphyrin-III C-methyltransferase/precorrin-2 dehydrogenase/sirohydrochlorin ferrochelatase